jgi:hypothetical protein
MTDIVSVHQLVSEAIVLSDAPKDDDDAAESED